MTVPVKTRARRRDSIAAEAAFRARVAELGGRVVEPEWLGASAAHRVVCREGHESTPRPANLARQGICRICSGLDPSSGEQSFRARVAELGGQILEPSWLGSKVRHRVICANGHEVRALPNSVQQGQGLCYICAGSDPVTAERKFREHVAARGGHVVEPTWMGTKFRHRVRCAAGHDNMILPSDLYRDNRTLCARCSGKCAEASEEKFRARVTELGGRVVEPHWLGTHERHRVICRAGHCVTVTPMSVLAGRGICRKCNNRVWDIFYVVVNEVEHRVKFGVTTNDSRPRLKTHRENGYGTVVKVITDLRTAAGLEQQVSATLRAANLSPVQGFEYYDISALPVILDVADHWEVAA